MGGGDEPDADAPPSALADPVRHRLDEIFGDVLPDVTRDEQADAARRADCGGGRVAASQPSPAPRRLIDRVVWGRYRRRNPALALSTPWCCRISSLPPELLVRGLSVPSGLVLPPDDRARPVAS